MKVQLLGKLTKPIKLGYDEQPLTELLKQILSLSQEKHLTISHRHGSIEIYFRGDMRHVQESLYKWLDEPERKKNFQSKITTHNIVSEIKRVQ